MRKSSIMNSHSNAKSVSAVVVALFPAAVGHVDHWRCNQYHIDDSPDPKVSDLAAVVFDAVSESSTPDKVPAGAGLLVWDRRCNHPAAPAHHLWATANTSAVAGAADLHRPLPLFLPM